MWHIIARQFALLSICACVIAGWIGRRRQFNKNVGYEIMLTGRFDSDNWILAHLGPLSASKKCSRIWMVSTNPVPELPKVIAIYPPKWLIKVMGSTHARLLTFLWMAMRKKPHIVGGFHIIVNGIMAAIVGRLVGAQSMYFCVGGPAEVRDGGIHSADSYFTKMGTPDIVVEKRLLKIISMFDIIITMGTRAVSFFRDKGIDTNFHVVSGGIDPIRFKPNEEAVLYDLIWTGRLVEVKRMDIFLLTVKKVVEKIPQNQLIETSLGKILPKLFGESIKEHKLKPATYPKFELVKANENEDWQIRAVSCEIPEIDLENRNYPNRIVIILKKHSNPFKINKLAYF